MANNSILTNKGKVILLNRGYKATPDYNPPIKFKLGTTQTTPLPAATGLTITITIGTVTAKTFVASYPTFDETKHEVTIRGYITSTECVGQFIDGSGQVNTDDELTSLDAWDGESKASTDEFAFIWVDRLI